MAAGREVMDNVALLWRAANEGDMNKVQTLLDKGTKVSSSGNLIIAYIQFCFCIGVVYKGRSQKKRFLTPAIPLVRICPLEADLQPPPPPADIHIQH